MAKKATKKKSKQDAEETKPKGFRNVPVSTIEAFDKMVEERDVNASELFTQMVKEFTGDNNDEADQLRLTIIEKDESITTLRSQITDLTNQVESFNQVRENNNSEIEAEKKKVLDLEQKVNTLETAAKTQIKLNPEKREFIGQMTDEAYEIARKVRSFLREQGYVSNNDNSYPNELMNLSIPLAMRALLPKLKL